MGHSNEHRVVLKKMMLLALLGLGLSVLLIREHYDDAQHFCDFNAVLSCSTVNKSDYAVLFNVPVAVLGVSWNVFLAVVAWLAAELEAGNPLLAWYTLLLCAWIAAGIGFVCYLIAAEFILGSICLLCTLVHLLTLGNCWLAARLHRLSFPPGRRVAASVKASGLVRHCQIVFVVFALLFVVPLVAFNALAMGRAESVVVDASSDYRELDVVRLCQCVTERNFVMYGSLTCSHCQHQKQLLDAGFAYIRFVDCDERCVRDNKVAGFPTWVSYDAAGTTELARLVGVQTPIDLANLTGCLTSATLD